MTTDHTDHPGLIPLALDLTPAQRAVIEQAAALRGIAPEAFMLEALLWELGRVRATPSRNVREGRYIGHAAGKAVRRHAPMPAMYAGDVEVFPACAPYVGAVLAWLTLRNRRHAVRFGHRRTASE